MKIRGVTAMQDPINLKKFTDELIDNEFFDINYFNGKKLTGK